MKKREAPTPPSEVARCDKLYTVSFVRGLRFFGIIYLYFLGLHLVFSIYSDIQIGGSNKKISVRSTELGEVVKATVVSYDFRM